MAHAQDAEPAEPDAAQESSPPPAPVVQPALLSTHGQSATTSAPALNFEEQLRLQEIAHLRAQARMLEASNRHWQTPAVLLGLGVATLITGAIVFREAWSRENVNLSMDRAGLVMMPLGAIVTLAMIPALVVPATRARRLRRVHSVLQRLGAPVDVGL